MGCFKIQWRASTRRDLRKLPPQEVARIVAAVGELAREPFPHGSEKLAGSEHTYRIRVGDYRVVYEVFRPIVGIVQRFIAEQAALGASFRRTGHSPSIRHDAAQQERPSEPPPRRPLDGCR